MRCSCGVSEIDKRGGVLVRIEGKTVGVGQEAVERGRTGEAAVVSEHAQLTKAHAW